MLMFWTLAGLCCALAAGLILFAARRSALPRAEADAATADAIRGRALARDLAELDRQVERGLVTVGDRDTARAEVARRHLSSSDATASDVRLPAPDPARGRFVLAGLILTVAVGLGLYMALGRPGQPDQPHAARVAEWARTPGMLDAPRLAAVMEAAARLRPQDFQAQALLGAARFEAGDPFGAATALRRAVALRPEDAQSWARLGEALVRSQDGEIGQDAEMAFRQALELDPNQLGARYFLGELALERGQAAQVHALWGPLIAILAPQDPRRRDLESRLPPLGGGEGG